MNSENPNTLFQITQLTKRGYIDSELLSKYRQSYQKDLLIFLRQILTMRKSSSQTSQLKTVSLEISQLKGKNLSNLFQSLISQRKTQKTRCLANLLFPNPDSRLQIQKVRSKLIKQIRKEQKFDKGDIELVMQLYHILNLDIQFNYEDVQNFINGQKLKQFKQKLTSLKKMIGDAPKLQQDQKQQKKKAYLKNLQFRRIIQSVANQIKCPQLRQKLHQIISTPKNKKWIGCRFHKLLIQNQWSIQQISIFSDQLKQFTNRQLKSKQKKLRKVKNPIKQLLKNMKSITENKIDMMGQKMSISQSIKKEQNQRMENQDSLSQVQSLISINYISYSSSELKVFDQQLDYDIEENDQLII